ncbi:protein gp37 [Sinosporangium album]|uniref:Protein gp37 n=1 Tax=Sinosporangium album TaxID=504805 RepID=A0A1G8EDG4_9ACTN|nr:phage Gp37/Gp68 family protein [Sinosporangium album]SDH67937.1 protein gp37 [Sinosporangium album]
MSTRTQIEWTDTTWNVASGCTRVSEGCRHCYIERTPPFRMAERHFNSPEIGASTGLVLHPERLDAPLKWRKPRRVFVNSLADLFNEDIPGEHIAQAFGRMAATERHVFQVLTKQHARMRSLLNDREFQKEVYEHAWAYDQDGKYDPYDRPDDWWPLPNVHIGVSVENQQWADTRIPALLQTPAAVRWISAEPLLGPIDLTKTLPHNCSPLRPCPRPIQRINWIVAGGESGPGARPAHPDWFRSLRDQCADADVPFHFKQWGEWAPVGPLYGDTEEADNAHMEAVALEVHGRREVIQLESDGYIAVGHQPSDPRTWLMARVGKKNAGRQLDGRTYDQYPNPHPSQEQQ